MACLADAKIEAGHCQCLLCDRESCCEPLHRGRDDLGICCGSCVGLGLQPQHAALRLRLVRLQRGQGRSVGVHLRWHPSQGSQAGAEAHAGMAAHHGKSICMVCKLAGAGSILCERRHMGPHDQGFVVSPAAVAQGEAQGFKTRTNFMTARCSPFSLSAAVHSEK